MSTNNSSRRTPSSLCSPHFSQIRMTRSIDKNSSKDGASRYEDERGDGIAREEKKEQIIEEKGKISATNSMMSIGGAPSAMYRETLSAVDLPPGFLDVSLFSSNDVVEMADEINPDIANQAEKLKGGDSTPQASILVDEVVAREKKAETSNVTLETRAPRRASIESPVTPIAKRPRLGEFIQIMAPATPLASPFSNGDLAKSLLPIPQADESTDEEEQTSDKDTIIMAKSKRKRASVVTILERQSYDAVTSPPLPSKKRQRLKLPTSLNRKVASRKLCLEEETETETEADIDDSEEDPHVGPNEQVIQSSTNVVYSWDSLKLGAELGSAALNDFFAYANEGRAPKLNSRQALQIISSMRVKTVLPPPGSDLHSVVHKNRVILDENHHNLENDQANAAGLPPMVPWKKLENVYETMCLQDIDDGSANRREVQYMNVDKLMETFRSFENQACDLKLREDEIMAKAKELGGGLIDKRLVYRMMGYRHARENWKPPVQYQACADPSKQLQTASI
jgi:hypothetical protein